MSSMTAEQIAELVMNAVASAMAATGEPTTATGEQIAELAENGAAMDRVTAKVLADAPGKRSAKATTEAKATTITRKLDPIAVEAGTSRFVVTPTYGDGKGIRRTAAVEMFETNAAGKVEKRRTLTVGLLTSLNEDVIGQLRTAIAKVEKAAKIGAHAIAK